MRRQASKYATAGVGDVADPIAADVAGIAAGGGGQLGEDVVGDLAEDLLLRVEVRVEGAGGDACLGRDVAEASIRERGPLEERGAALTRFVSGAQSAG